MLRIAHRGASGEVPENTLAAVSRAIERGAAWVEVDVQACVDGLVVIHDRTLERTTDGSGPVAGHTLAALRMLDAGAGERIPLPNEMLALCRGRCGLNLELKGPGVASGLLVILNQALADGWRAQDLLASSFDWAQLKELDGALPRVPLGVLTERVDAAACAIARELGAAVIGCALAAVDAAAVAAAHQAGCRLWVFTVNATADFERMAALGVDGVFTDHADYR